MRRTRLVAALLALVLALSLALSLLVGVVEATASPAVPADSADQGAAGKPRHVFKVDAKQVRPGVFVLYGKVLTYSGREIGLLRSVAHGRYEPVRPVRLDGHGRFRTRIHQVGTALTCFKVVVPATHDHRRSVSRGASCIVR